jgi:hypothetical protein
MNWKHLALVMLACFATTVANAQDGPQNINVVAIKINPGGQAAFEAFMTRYKEAVEKNGDDRTWNVSTNAIGPVTQYTISSLMPSFAALGNPPNPLASMAEAFGEEEAAAILASIQDSVAEINGRAWIARPDLSRPIESDATPVGLTILFIDVKPGGQTAFEAYGKQLVEASNKMDDGNWAMAIGAPGAPSDYLVTIPIFKWADLDTPQGMPLRERMIAAFGERNGAKMFAEGVASIENITTSLIRGRPDLSRPPPQ